MKKKTHFFLIFLLSVFKITLRLGALKVLGINSWKVL